MSWCFYPLVCFFGVVVLFLFDVCFVLFCCVVCFFWFCWLFVGCAYLNVGMFNMCFDVSSYVLFMSCYCYCLCHAPCLFKIRLVVCFEMFRNMFCVVDVCDMFSHHFLCLIVLRSVMCC